MWYESNLIEITIDLIKEFVDQLFIGRKMFTKLHSRGRFAPRAKV